MSDHKTSGGIGLTGAVFLVFLTLKLLGAIDWSWWWVTAPLWVPASVFLGIAFVCLAFAGLVWLGERLDW